jgi:hypothetical protein
VSQAHAGRSIDAQIQERIRGAEAAYFFSEDYHKSRQIRTEDAAKKEAVASVNATHDEEE